MFSSLQIALCHTCACRIFCLRREYDPQDRSDYSPWIQYMAGPLIGEKHGAEPIPLVSGS